MYERNVTTWDWDLIQNITNPDGAVGWSRLNGDEFGSVIALDNHTLVITSPLVGMEACGSGVHGECCNDDDVQCKGLENNCECHVGAVYVYGKVHRMWTLQSTLQPFDCHEFNDTWLHHTVDVREDVIAIGNPSYNNSLGMDE